MDLEGDNPAPRHSGAPGPVATENIHVTPENVVALAVLFRTCVDLLDREIPHLDGDLRLIRPWLGDPVSKWALDHFNRYFVDGAVAFKTIVQAEHEQHMAVRDALVATARQYGLTEELVAAGFTEIGEER